MKEKSATPGAGKGKLRILWRPANALSIGASSRATLSKAGKSRKNPRGRKPTRRP